MSANKSRMKLVRSLRSGQVTIPAEFRRELGIEDDSLLQITLDEGELRIRPVHLRETPEVGSLKALYAYFAPVRDEAREQGLTEDEIEDAIDRAVAAVRARHD